MFRKYGLPSLALLGFIMAIAMILITARKPPTPPILFMPPQSPYLSSIAAAGIVESSSENIKIGVPFHELIDVIYVTPGQFVKKNEPLFSLNQRSLTAQLQEKLSLKDVAIKEYEKLLASPRREEIPIALAKMNYFGKQKDEALSIYGYYQRVRDLRAISQTELTEKRLSSEASEEAFLQAKAEYDLLLAGAWDKDVAISKAKIDQAQSSIEFIQTQLERSIIRAPCDGVVLQVNARIGESSTLFSDSSPLMIFGSLSTYYIRIDIDQDEAWRYTKGASATAFVRGNSSIRIPLQFVRIEPFVIPKTAFTGDTVERVDTRVLQVLYEFSPDSYPVYPGIIMDVFIEARPYS